MKGSKDSNFLSAEELEAALLRTTAQDEPQYFARRPFSSTPARERVQDAAGVAQRLTVQYRLISSLKLDPKNPRLHSKKQIRQLAKSIEAFSFNNPVLIDAGGRVISGHGRVLACQLLGIQEVPTIALEHLNEEQARAFMIADNQLTINADWDERLLAEQLKALAEVDLNFSLEVTGLEMGEIDARIEALSVSAEDDSDPADELPEQTDKVQVAQPGDTFQLGRNRIRCADATQASSYPELMEGQLAAASFTDKPYNVHIDGHATGLGKTRHAEFPMASGEMTEAEFTDFLTSALRCQSAHCCEGAILFECMDWRHLTELLIASRRANLDLKNLCVWVKDNAGMGSFYRSQHELVFVFKNGKGQHRNNVQLGQFGRYRTNVWQYPGANSFSRNSEEGNLLALHPTVKPVAMVADAIMDCSARGDIILDPFLGSGTTLIAAERTGRICYGIELDPQYIDTAIRRWQAFTGKVAIHVQSERTFNEIEKEKSNG